MLRLPVSVSGLGLSSGPQSSEAGMTGEGGVAVSGSVQNVRLGKPELSYWMRSRSRALAMVRAEWPAALAAFSTSALAAMPPWVSR